MRRAAVAALALLLALTGCAGFPTSGGVGIGEVISEEFDSGIVFGPDGPQEGATQEEILNGFLQAAVAPGRRYQIARQFLDERIREEWNPNELVSIRDDAGTITRTNRTTLSYSFVASAYVDPDGIYSEEAPTTQRFEVQFTENEDGEWRISDVPDGIVLASVRFDSVFDDFPLWFFDPSFAYLVPDVRWFATGRSDLESAVVGELLGGPAPYLGQGAVVTAFPPGTVRGDVVEIDDGTATVDLSGEAAETAELERDRMRQQLTETLRGQFNVTGAEITVEGIALPTPDVPGPDAITKPNVEGSPLVLRDGEFGYATGDSTMPIAGISGQVESLQPTAVTYAGDSSVAVVRNADGVVLVRTGTEPLLIDQRAGLVPPSLDPMGFVWSAREASATSIKAFDFARGSYEIRSNLPSDARIVAMRVSRDGARMLLALETSTGPRLIVKGIVREGTVPVGLTAETLAFPIADGTPLDAAWVDERSVALLADEAAARTVTRFDVGGPRERLGVAAGGTVIAGGNGGVGGLRVLADGVLLQRRGTSWLPTRVEASVLAEQR
ncbi:LpqB family beta-propeller domain-containing protein [Lysobacter korlensis]|uniref:LpqB family beta-propeller domain-containing protein n=1 Tax=Lysobacter korlensis TaxID=553636 RepID=A0ABV6RWM0_9GAMM